MKKKKIDALFELGVVVEYLHEIQSIFEIELGPSDLARDLDNKNTFMSGYLSAYEIVQGIDDAKKLLDSELVQEWCKDTKRTVAEINALGVLDKKYCNDVIDMLGEIAGSEMRDFSPSKVEVPELTDKPQPQKATTPIDKKTKVLKFPNNKERMQ